MQGTDHNHRHTTSMVEQPITASLLKELDKPSSAVAKIHALTLLKNELIGHDQKKEAWVLEGVIPSLAWCISPGRRENGLPPLRIANGSDPAEEEVEPTVDETIRYQSTIILGSLAQGGPAFVAPLMHASAISALLSALSPSVTSPKLIVATLRTLNVIADALSRTLDYGPVPHGESLSDLMFADGHVQKFAEILAQSSPDPLVQKQISGAACLIAKTCREEWQQASLANAGALDALATRLASFVVSMGFVLPGAEAIARKNGNLKNIPAPAARTAELYPILDAINAIIQDSKLRAAQLLYAPPIMAVFPRATAENAPDGAARHGLAESALRSSYLNLIDCLLPQVPTPHHKHSSAASSAFPPLGSASHRTRRGGDRASLADQSPSDLDPSLGNTSSELEDEESPLIAWLIYLTRGEHDITRLLAASVLTVLYRSGLASKKREVGLALLIVPLLVTMLDEDTSLPPRSRSRPFAGSGHDFGRAVEQTIQELAPAVLAMLVTDSLELQKAAVDAQAIKKLSARLKTACARPLPSGQAVAWTRTSSPPPADKHASDEAMLTDRLATSSLGDAGLTAAEVHEMAVRGSTLKALAALAPFKDEYRKMIIDNGVTPLIVISLKPVNAGPSTPGTNGGQATDDPASREQQSAGNPPFVLIAACGAVRALSRSVSILRTSLIDAGVAMPLFALLTNPDLEVQIAATAAVCNLVLEFSPMREAIMKAGVLQILCGHAHNVNSRLRLNALWALKNLVCSAENEIKMSCLEELGRGWLVKLICDDTEKAALVESGQHENDIASLLESPGEAARQDQEDSMTGMEVAEGGDETGDERDEDDNDGVMADSIGALCELPTFDPTARRHADPPRPPFSHAPPLSAIPRIAPAHSPNLTSRIPPPVMLYLAKEEESNPTQKAGRDDRAVQEQGLAFIRNLICGPENMDMIDFLFANLGQEIVFEILASKLRNKVVPPAKTSGSRRKLALERGDSAKVVPPHGEIIVAVCFILVHIAASHPRHRQLLISHTELLKLLLPFFSHSNKNVRVALTWIIINLTWLDDQADQAACKGRAMELRKLGFQAKLEGLENDAELDVRERTKTALCQIRQAIGF